MRRLATQPARELLSVTRSMVDQVVIPGNRVDIETSGTMAFPTGPTDCYGCHCQETSTPVIKPPVEPMLAKLADGIPAGRFLFEPKWDGFRSSCSAAAMTVFIQSRDPRPLDRYFPELHEVSLSPPRPLRRGRRDRHRHRQTGSTSMRCNRLHPAAPVSSSSRRTPSAFVAFRPPADGGRTCEIAPQKERRAAMETARRTA